MTSNFRNIVSHNPFTNQFIKKFDFITDAELGSKIQMGHNGFLKFKQSTFKERSEKFNKLAQLIDKNCKQYAELITTEMGKPITQSTFEAKKSANHCRYFADNLERFLKIERIKTEVKKSCVIYEPLGIIYLMVPFNFPFFLTFKACIPMMASGNTILLRNSDSTPQVGLALEELFKNAGFDNGEFQNVFSTPPQLEQICRYPQIRGISFTGSSQAGSFIAQTAGKYLKPCSLELGGSDPFVVLHDADIEHATKTAVIARLLNAGQVCIAAKRFIIHKAVYDQFVSKLIAKIKDYKIGNPFLATTDMGPMARHDLRQNIQKQIENAEKGGARLLYEGKLEGTEYQNGFFQAPLVYEVTSENLLFKEEVFGPVFALCKANSESEAIELANQTPYGLGGAIFSQDVDRAEKLARKLDCGAVFINEMVKSDSRMPSGGTKISGYGRECGEAGIKQFTNIKTLWVL